MKKEYISKENIKNKKEFFAVIKSTIIQPI